MSGNTPAELIERLRRVCAEDGALNLFAGDYINPDGPEAADQLTVLTARVEELEAAIRAVLNEGEDGLRAALTGEKG